MMKSKSRLPFYLLISAIFVSGFIQIECTGMNHGEPSEEDKNVKKSMFDDDEKSEETLELMLQEKYQLMGQQLRQIYEAEQRLTQMLREFERQREKYIQIAKVLKAKQMERSIKDKGKRKMNISPADSPRKHRLSMMGITQEKEQQEHGEEELQEQQQQQEMEMEQQKPSPAAEGEADSQHSARAAHQQQNETAKEIQAVPRHPSPSSSSSPAPHPYTLSPLIRLQKLQIHQDLEELLHVLHGREWKAILPTIVHHFVQNNADADGDSSSSHQPSRKKPKADPTEDLRRTVINQQAHVVDENQLLEAALASVAEQELTLRVHVTHITPFMENKKFRVELLPPASTEDGVVGGNGRKVLKKRIGWRQAKGEGSKRLAQFNLTLGGWVQDGVEMTVRVSIIKQKDITMEKTFVFSPAHLELMFPFVAEEPITFGNQQPQPAHEDEQKDHSIDVENGMDMVEG